eukprot:TRINITY_DN2086_c2_g1_i1.p1 TRINITY_DN2086_c2_g1~~TRINITY_DN2086_c2_g1_i1.p1  ORF type:complete len:151 (+),score=27.46 TRINITY_DN2086_c2_g1_i1:216-668(+)
MSGKPNGNSEGQGAGNGSVPGAASSFNAGVQATQRAEDVEDLMAALEGFTPTIPDEVATYYLNKTGFVTEDPRIIKLVSLAAQKFIHDVSKDAYQYARVRQTSQQQAYKPGKDKDGKLALTLEDLSDALGEQGIRVAQPPYYVNDKASKK